MSVTLCGVLNYSGDIYTARSNLELYDCPAGNLNITAHQALFGNVAQDSWQGCSANSRVKVWCLGITAGRLA